MKVLKLGGSSLASPARVPGSGPNHPRRTPPSPSSSSSRRFKASRISLSTVPGWRERGDSTYERMLQEIARRHRSAVARLIGRRSRVQAETERLLTEPKDTLHGIFLLRHCPLQALDVTASFGERLSALIVAAHLNKLPSGRSSSTRGSSSSPTISSRRRQWRLPRQTGQPAPTFAQLFRPALAPRDPYRDRLHCGDAVDGRTTTIGRNGSDYTRRHRRRRRRARRPSRSGPTSTAC